MTDLERDCLETFYVIRAYCTARNLKVGAFYDMMTHVRDIIKKLENVSFGCVHGKHASACDCSAVKAGRALPYKKTSLTRIA